jgi:hypothetical protein
MYALGMLACMIGTPSINSAWLVFTIADSLSTSKVAEVAFGVAIVAVTTTLPVSTARLI